MTIRVARSFSRIFPIALLALALGGCATTRAIDSEVQSFAGTPPAVKGAAYTFERLPSQQAHPEALKALEDFAEKALTQAGLVRDDQQPLYNVQMDLTVDQSTRASPPALISPRVVMAPDGSLWQRLSPFMLEQKWTVYRVHLVIRHRASAQVNFESKAMFEGPWSDTNNLLPVLLEAALRDFPTPPTGVRKVVIELPSASEKATP
jgi:hypothetical protein